MSQVVAESSKEVGQFVDELAREYLLDVPERRSEPRYSITMPVIAEAADADFCPVGRKLRAVTRDLSRGGIGLICQDPLDCNLIVRLVSPRGNLLRVKARMLRCEPNGFYFDVGCEFVTD
jgi:hypothetical protein